MWNFANGLGSSGRHSYIVMLGWNGWISPAGQRAKAPAAPIRAGHPIRPRGAGEPPLFPSGGNLADAGEENTV